MSASDNSGGSHRYSFRDAGAPAGDVLYRLRQTGIDGTAGYSRIATVRTHCENMVQIYPNPTHDYITVKGAIGGSQLQLINAMGLVVRQQPAGASGTRVSLSGITYGFYWLRVLQENVVIGQYKIVYAEK